jgi:hypothetical protein
MRERNRLKQIVNRLIKQFKFLTVSSFQKSTVSSFQKSSLIRHNIRHQAPSHLLIETPSILSIMSMNYVPIENTVKRPPYDVIRTIKSATLVTSKSKVGVDVPRRVVDENRVNLSEDKYESKGALDVPRRGATHVYPGDESSLTDDNLHREVDDSSQEVTCDDSQEMTCDDLSFGPQSKVVAKTKIKTRSRRKSRSIRGEYLSRILCDHPINGTDLILDRAISNHIKTLAIPEGRFLSCRSKDIWVKVRKEGCGLKEEPIVEPFKVVSRLFFYLVCHNILAVNPTTTLMTYCTKPNALFKTENRLMTEDLSLAMFGDPGFRIICQKRHEHLKSSILTAVLHFRRIPWMTEDMAIVLQDAAAAWSTENTFFAQQLRANDVGNQPYTIFEFIIRFVNLIHIDETNTEESTTSNLESYILSIILYSVEYNVPIVYRNLIGSSRSDRSVAAKLSKVCSLL